MPGSLSPGLLTRNPKIYKAGRGWPGLLGRKEKMFQFSFYIVHTLYQKEDIFKIFIFY
jgi:hypothetical protein